MLLGPGVLPLHCPFVLFSGLLFMGVAVAPSRTFVQFDILSFSFLKL
jgi:hypothetical protein